MTTTPNSTAMQQDEAVSVEIYDQVYVLRGSDPAYIQHLAHAVDAKMRAVSSQGSTVDSLRVAVLAALNIADELARQRQRYEQHTGNLQQSIRTRAGSISGMLDDILLEPARKAG